MNKKGLFIGGGAVALVALIVTLIFIFTGGEEAYRSIKVFEIDGSCKVERDGDTLDAFKNMALSSGDTLTVGDGSFTRLKLDDDKYVYLEANTKINLTATGTANDSKTMVYIERGSMLTEVKKKLSATSSYDIVTPNTTMSIRGTKTLTEVYEDVLGAIKTSAAVVEGQVKFSTIQKDKTGKAVIVSTDLSVGQGFGVTTDSKDLLSEDDVKHVADDGKTVDGQTAEETTHEELGSVLETPAFSDEFLTNIVAVLTRSREEDVEEGFTAENVTEEELNAAINVLNDVIDGNVELPPVIEEYILNQAQSYYNEPVVYDTPVTGGNTDTGSAQQPVEDNADPVVNDTDNAIIEDVYLTTDEAGEDPDVDDQETPAGTDNNETDDTPRNGDSDETDDGDKTEEGESEEERIAREEKERLEKEEAERLEKEEQEKNNQEEKERLEKEEKEKQEKEKQEKEKQEKEKAEKEAAEREEAERLALEEAEREAAEQAESEAQQNNSSNNSSSNNSTTNSNSPFVDSIQNVSFSSGTSSNSVRVRVGFVMSSESTGSSNVVTASDLPNMSAGDILPGYTGSAYEAIVIPADDTSGSAHGSDLYGSVSSTYGFTGWYNNAEDAAANDLSRRVMTYPESASSDIQLYPGISKTSTLIIMNPYGQGAGNIVNAGNLPDGVIDFTAEGNEAIYKVIEGTTVTLPVPESGSDINHPYIRKVSASGVNTEFYCYSTSMSLDVSKLYLSNSTAATVGSDKVYYATGSAPTVTVSGDYMTLYMYFVSPVELRLATNGGTLLVSDVYSQSQSTVTVQNMAETSTPQALPGATENTYLPAQKWTVSSQNGSAYDYVFRTVYFGRGFSLPKFTKVTTAPSSGNQGQGSDPGSSSSSEPLYPGVEEDYSRELLCNYRLSSNGPLARFSAEDPVAFENGSENRWIDTGIEYDSDGKCVFTAQLLDWVYMDLRFANEDESDKKYSIGESIPYVILDEEDERAGMYKFAVSPRDLFAAANATTEFGFTVQQTEANDYPKYIYAPDDLIYPWNSVGAKRTATMSDSPTDEMSVLSQSLKNSYAYMGVKNKRLTGYKVFYHNFEYQYINYTGTGDFTLTYSLNELTTSELFDDFYLRADACLVGGKDSAACKIPLTMAESAIKGYGGEGREAWDEGDSRLAHPIVFTPKFETPRTVNVSLEYSTTRNNSGGFTLDSSIIGRYKLVFSGLDGSCFDAGSLHFDNLIIEVGSLYGGFVKLQSKNSIYKDYSYANQGFEYYVGEGETKYAMNTELENDNGETIYVPLNHSILSFKSGSLPSGGFVRGLSTVTDTIETYRPTKIRPIPARSEANKFSCFVTEYNNGSSTSTYYYSRVFTASDTFTSNTVYGTNTVDGLIMDIAGSSNVSDENKWSNDVYGKAYYGGVVKPYITDGGTINFGTPSGSIGSSDMSTYTRSVTRLGAASYIGTNIAEFLGIGSNGVFEKAGMFFFEPYTRVSVSSSDLNNAYAYYSDQYDPDNNPGARRPSPWLVDGTNDKWEWKSVADKLGEESNVLGNLPLHRDSVHLIPDGFVIVLYNNEQYLLYTGTESYTVNMVGNGSTQSDVDAKDHRVNASFKTESEGPVAHTVTIINTFPEAGVLTYPDFGGGVLSYTSNSSNNSVTITGLQDGDRFALPEVEALASRRDESGYTSSAYISVNEDEPYTKFYCFSTSDDLDIARMKLTGEDRTEINGEYVCYNAYDSSAPSSALPEQQRILVDRDITLYMYFTSQVELRTSIPESSRGALGAADASGEIKTLETIFMDACEAQDTYEPVVNLRSGQSATQAWQIKAAAGGNYNLYTFYSGKAFVTPRLSYVLPAGGQSANYQREILRNLKTSAASETVNPYMNSVAFYESGSSMFPFNAEDRSGRYILTEQAVDWVYMDFNLTDMYGSDDLKTSVGVRNPFVIMSSDYGEGLRYKFAVNPKNLYKDSEIEEDKAPYDYIYTNNSSGVTPSYFIYAPDDIVYPWRKLGQQRGESDDPNVMWNELGDNNLSSYSFVGVKGYRLAGFTEYYSSDGSPTSSNFILHKTNGVITDTAYPCVLDHGQGESIANMLVLWQGITESIEDYLDSTGAWILKPLFAPLKPFEVSLQYTETPVTNGGYLQKASVKQNYSVVISNIDRVYVKGIKLNNIKADVCALRNRENSINSGEFVNNTIFDTVTYADDMAKYIVSRNDGLSNPDPNVVTPTINSNRIVSELRIPLAYLHAIINDGINGTYNFFEQKNCFVRGLTMDQDHAYIDFTSWYDVGDQSSGSSGDSDSYDAYMPGNIKVVVGDSEAYKYSCFVTDDTDSQGNVDYTFARVFEKNAVFSVDNSKYGNDKIISGVLADLYGVDKTDDAYYGGEVSMLGSQYYTIPGEDPIINEDTRGVVRISYTGSNPANPFFCYTENSDGKLDNLLYGYDRGGAGVWVFRPYKSVKVLNPDDDIYVRDSYFNPEYSRYLDGPYSGFKSYYTNTDNTFGLGFIHGSHPINEYYIGVWEAYKYTYTDPSTQEQEERTEERSGGFYLGPDENYDDVVSDGLQSTTTKFYHDYRATVLFSTAEKVINHE